MGKLQFNNKNEADFTKWNDLKELYDLQSSNLETLSRWEALMKPQGKHIKKRTRDISNATFHMCQGLVDLAKYMHKNDIHYIIFG